MEVGCEWHTEAERRILTHTACSALVVTGGACCGETNVAKCTFTEGVHYEWANKCRVVGDDVCCSSRRASLIVEGDTCVMERDAGDEAGSSIIRRSVGENIFHLQRRDAASVPERDVCLVCLCRLCDLVSLTLISYLPLLIWCNPQCCGTPCNRRNVRPTKRGMRVSCAAREWFIVVQRYQLHVHVRKKLCKKVVASKHHTHAPERFSPKKGRYCRHRRPPLRGGRSR